MAAGLTALLSACSALIPDPAGAARPCAEVFVIQRCDAILVATADNAGVDPANVVSVTILASPTQPEGQVGGRPPTPVRLLLADGRTAETSFACPGMAAAFQPECMPDPRVVLSNLIENGYRDFPEGATPVPEIEPEAMAAAVPLSIERLEIPIDGPGPKRFRLGGVALANGIVQEATFNVEGSWPEGFVLRRGAVSLELVAAGQTEPIWNIYEHGWVEGTEQVDVFLVFDVGLLRPGARLVVLDVRVR